MKTELAYDKFDRYIMISFSVSNHSMFCTRASRLLLSLNRHYENFSIFVSGKLEWSAGLQDSNRNVFLFLSWLCVLCDDKTQARNSLQCCTREKIFFQSGNSQLFIPRKWLQARYFMSYTQEPYKKATS